MAHVVTEACNDCKYTDCVVVCPVDCFYQDETSLYIDPDECIDCAACVDECPVQAIYADSDVPAQWKHFIQLNADKSKELKQSGKPTTVKQTPQEGPGCKK